jgi:hypothetical protein
MSKETQLTAKLVVRRSENYEHYLFYCPGCQEVHPYCTKSPFDHAQWQFNGNVEKPTFTPSLLIVRTLSDYVGCGPRCHLFVTDGKIAYCSDCEHGLAGQTVDMVDYPKEQLSHQELANGVK